MGPRAIIRVVLDTNVVISALLFGGELAKIVDAWKNGRILPLCSKEIMEEYLRVLSYPKFQLTEEEISYLLTQEILPWFEVVEVLEGPSFVKEDPADDKFIWCALEGRAEYIVSGDQHLLSYENSPVPVLSVKEFLIRLSK